MTNKETTKTPAKWEKVVKEKIRADVTAEHLQKCRGTSGGSDRTGLR